MSASSPCLCLKPLISLLFVSLSCPIFVSWGRSRSASKVCGKLRFLFATNSSILQDMSITQSHIFLVSTERIVILCSYWSAAAQLFKIVSISAYIHSFILFYDVLWCFMMFYDILCLESILGFLLTERTSGVSPVIFLISRTCSANANCKLQLSEYILCTYYIGHRAYRAYCT